MKRSLIWLLGWLIALILPFHSMLLSGFAVIPGDEGDTRLINYGLEHTYRWVLREPTHRDLFSPPVFYPHPNTAAYADLLVSAGPFYWCWRVLGFPLDTAFQLWLLTIGSLNYLTAHTLLKRAFHLDGLPTACGAVLFAAASSRVAVANHPQLLIHFFTTVSLYGLVRLFEPEKGTGTFSGGWLGVFFLGGVLQLYASFYLGWFFAMGVAVALGWACCWKATRTRLFAVLRRHYLAAAGWFVASAVLVLPLALHYLQAAREQGLREYISTTPYMPVPPSWLYSGENSWFYGWMPLLVPDPGFHVASEHQLGIGFLTSAVACWGLWRQRDSAVPGVLLATAASLVVAVTMWVPPYSLWQLVRAIVPGAAAMRAVGRIGLLLLLPASVGVALALQRCRHRWVAAALALACVLEQGRLVPAFSKEANRERVQQVVEQVPPDCQAFLYFPVGPEEPLGGNVFQNLDAMWAELATGRPTLNGYSGCNPPDWPFSDEHPSAVEESLHGWVRKYHLDPEKIHWIKTSRKK
jgi:hypothetical protein